MKNLQSPRLQLPLGEGGRSVPSRAGGPPEAVLLPSEFARQRLAFYADDLQSAVLDSAAKRGILLCTRQWGKSTVLAAKAVHRAFTTPRALILAASPGDRQSRLFLDKAAGFLASLDIRRRGGGSADASLLLPNGSQIVALPGSEATIRGFSAPQMILIDEAARVDDSLYNALRPMLATCDGDMWLLSTPGGKSGFFYDAWTHGEGWERFTATAEECPRISGEWLGRQRAEMPDAEFRQEYLCEFVDTEDAWFPRDLVEAALSDEEPI